MVDKNAIRILDQEMRDSTAELAKSKEALTRVMAQRQLSANRGTALLAKRKEYEGYVQGALGKGDEALAREVALKLSDVERDLQAEASNVQGLDTSITSLKTAIRDTETQLTRLKQQINTVKATEAVQRAQSASCPATSSLMHSSVFLKCFTCRSMCFFTSSSASASGTWLLMNVWPSPHSPYEPMSTKATFGLPS